MLTRQLYFLAFCAWLATRSVHASTIDSQDLDARAVLQGVANVRASIGPTRCRLRINRNSRIGETTEEYTVSFEGTLRRYESVNTPRTRTVYDGKKIMHYHGENAVNLRSMSDPMGEFFVDPRTLGITTTYRPDRSPEECVRLHDAVSMDLIDDSISNLVREAHWHCRVVDFYGQQHDFWVGQTPTFPVLRYEYWLSPDRRSTISEYADASTLPLPSKVTTRCFRDDREISEEIIEVFEAEQNVSIDPNVWTLTGLAVPIGTEVVDLEGRKRVGYWDGEGLSELPPTPGEVRARAQERKQTSIRKWLIGVNAVAFGVLLLAWTCRRVIFQRARGS